MTHRSKPAVLAAATAAAIAVGATAALVHQHRHPAVTIQNVIVSRETLRHWTLLEQDVLLVSHLLALRLGESVWSSLRLRDVVVEATRSTLLAEATAEELAVVWALAWPGADQKEQMQSFSRAWMLLQRSDAPNQARLPGSREQGLAAALGVLHLVPGEMFLL